MRGGVAATAGAVAFAIAVLATIFATAAEAVPPGSVGPGDTGFTLTLAARVCDEYTDVRANRERNNIQESLRDLGPDTNYADGEAITPVNEDAAPQDDCDPLVGWRFTVGNGYTSGNPANLSVVTNPEAQSIVTEASVPELSPCGTPVGTNVVEGAVTIEPTGAQLQRALVGNQSPGGPWVQGGLDNDPLLVDEFGPIYGFAALRCATDNLNGDNVEWVGYPEGASHVFCYAYYISPPPGAGTITVVKQIAGGGTDTVTFPFGGTVSYNPGGAFNLTVTNGQPASASVVRGATDPDDPSTIWQVIEEPVAGWAPAGPPVCTAPGGSEVGIAGVTVSISLVEADTVTCTYTNQRSIPGLFTIYKQTQGGVGGPFPFTVQTPNGQTAAAAASTTAEGTPVVVASYPLPGSYIVTETLPATTPAGSWALTEVTCNGAPVPVTNNAITVQVPLDPVTGCTFTNTFTPATTTTTTSTTTTTPDPGPGPTPSVPDPPGPDPGPLSSTGTSALDHAFYGLVLAGFGLLLSKVANERRLATAPLSRGASRTTR